MIETLAGLRAPGFNGDGIPASEAGLHTPSGLAADGKGNLYIADLYTYRVLRIDAAGMITTVAGSGRRGSAGDGGLATEAEFEGPSGLALDGAGNLYVAEYHHHRVRRIDPNGILTTAVGTGQQGFRGDGGWAVEALLDGPAGLAADEAGNLFVADSGNHRVRRIGPDGVIKTVAGTGRFGSVGDGGPAAEAYLWGPSGLAVGKDGSLFVADRGNHRVRRIDRGGVIETVAGARFSGYSGDLGAAAAARLFGPEGLALDPEGNVYVGDVGNHRVRKIDLAGVITTVAGNGTIGFSGDGEPGSNASIYQPEALAADTAGNLFIADSGNHNVRVVRLDRTVSIDLGSSGKRVDFVLAPGGLLRRNGKFGSSSKPVGQTMLW